MAPFVDLAPNIVGTVVTLVVLGIIVFPLRIFVRLSKDAWGWDDWCMVIAAVPWAAFSSVCIGGAFHGVGVHQARLDTDQIHDALMWFWLFEVLWCVAIVPVKLSISFMIGRIAIVKRPLVIGLYTFSALLVAITMLGFFYIIFRCTPISYAWNDSIPGGRCQPADDLTYIYYTTTAVNIAIDWYCAFLPVPLLWSAPLPLKAKLSVGFLLSLGVLASVSACVRQKYTIALTSSHDEVYSVGNLVIWGYAEVGIGFFVGSLSTLRPLFSRGPDDSSQSIALRRQTNQEEYPISRMSCPQGAANADMKRMSHASRESYEEESLRSPAVTKAVELNWPLP